MKVSKQHFQAIADVICERRRTALSEDERGILNDLSHSFADLFTRNNERFDRERFLRACGYPDLN